MEQREQTQMANIWNQRGDIFRDCVDIKGIIVNYYEQIYANILKNLKRKYLLKDMNYQGLQKKEWFTSIKESKIILKNLPTKKT